MKQLLQTLATLFGIVVIIIGGYMFIERRYALREKVVEIEQRYAPKEEVKRLEIRLDMKILNDYIKQTQSRIWALEERIKIKPDDVTAQEEIRRLKDEKKNYEDELKDLRNKSSS